MTGRSRLQTDEDRRLAALFSFDILDTPRERDFDDVAELASQICCTPIAVVNLIGAGRQFFKAEVGLGVRETPLESSFCAKAILEEEFLVVPDATKDPRFDCNPLVTGEPRLRFYAGALLRTQEGEALGTVCVLGFEPRVLTPLQEKALRVLARQVMRQLELRRALRERAEAQAQQKLLALELGHRIKNSLAVVMSIAAQTLKGVTEQDAVRAFQQRLAVLGQAHDVLLRGNWRAAPVQTIVDLVSAVHGGQKIVGHGPQIMLGPKTAVSLSLLLHELGTNAIKHGALSADAGRVAVAWRVAEDDGEPMLILSWRESGGPPAAAPSRKGFGTRLIDRGLIGQGGVEKTYDAAGLSIEFRAPLAAAQEVIAQEIAAQAIIAASEQAA